VLACVCKNLGLGIHQVGIEVGDFSLDNLSYMWSFVFLRVT